MENKRFEFVLLIILVISQLWAWGTVALAMLTDNSFFSQGIPTEDFFWLIFTLPFFAGLGYFSTSGLSQEKTKKSMNIIRFAIPLGAAAVILIVLITAFLSGMSPNYPIKMVLEALSKYGSVIYGIIIAPIILGLGISRLKVLLSQK